MAHTDIGGKFLLKGRHFLPQDVPPAVQHLGNGGINLSLVGQVVGSGIGLGNCRPPVSTHR